MPDYGRTLPRRGERPVILTLSPTGHLNGTQFYEHAELPPIIDVPSVGRALYREVWERMGWTVSEVTG